MTENISSFVVAGVTYTFDTKLAHLGSVLVDALRGNVSDDVIMSKLCDNGILDSLSNAKYRESKAQERFDKLEEKNVLVTLASEVYAIASKLQDIETNIKTTRGNFRVDVSTFDYSPDRADVTNVARWLEVLKTALEASKAAAEASLNAPDTNGVTKLSMLAGYQSAYTGKQNALREALDKLGFNTHNLSPDGKLVARPAMVAPAKAKSARGTGGKHSLVVTDKAGNKREFASKLECAQKLTAEGAIPADAFNDYQRNVYTKTETFWAILAKSGIVPA